MPASIRVPADPEGYRLIEPVDRGEMRSVWRARHLTSGDLRLVSLLPGTDDPAPLARIEQETQLLTKLPEIAVAGFLEIVPHESGWALVAEDDVDQSVRTFVDAHGPVSAPDAVHALAPVADALAATHHVKLVHGDVNAATVLITTDGSCALGEFGVSRYLRHSSGASASPSNPPASKMAAPEVRREERALPAADVYGFSRVLLYLLSGDADLTDPLALLSVGGSRPSASLVAVLEQCLRPDPLDRPADGDALVDLLSETPEYTSAARRLPALVKPQSKKTSEQDQRNGRTTTGAAANEVSTSASDAGRKARLGTAAIAVIALLAFAFAVFRAPAPTEGSGPLRPEAEPRPAQPVTVSFTTVVSDPVCPGTDGGQPVDANGVPIPSAANALEADLDGDGCPDRVRWWVAENRDRGWRAHATLSTRDQPVVLTLGDTGDLLFFGAWNCAPTQTPALYRPSTGEVFTLAEWPRAGERLDLVATDVLPSNITPTVVAADAGCETLTA